MTDHMTQPQLGSQSQTVMRDRNRYGFSQLTNAPPNCSRTAPPVLTNCVRAPPIVHHVCVKTCHHTTLTEFGVSPKMRGEVLKYSKR